MPAAKKDRSLPLCEKCGSQHALGIKHEVARCDTCEYPLYRAIGIAGRPRERHVACRRLHDAFEELRAALAAVPNLTFGAMRQFRSETFHVLNTSLNTAEHAHRAKRSNRLVHLQGTNLERPQLARCGHDGRWMKFGATADVTCPRCRAWLAGEVVRQVRLLSTRPRTWMVEPGAPILRMRRGLGVWS
jgi:hypothetical protein